MSDTEAIMKRCQRGATNLNDANNLLADCYGMLGALAAERDQYNEELSACKEGPGTCGYWRDAARSREQERDKVKAENEELRRNADRYCFLRDGPDDLGLSGAESMEEIDEMIDAAMSKDG